MVLGGGLLVKQRGEPVKAGGEGDDVLSAATVSKQSIACSQDRCWVVVIVGVSARIAAGAERASGGTPCQPIPAAAAWRSAAGGAGQAGGLPVL